jgi:hypothetical protein
VTTGQEGAAEAGAGRKGGRAGQEGGRVYSVDEHEGNQ